jgi:hypothetical protein
MSNRSFSEKTIQCDSENWPPLLIGYNFSLILKKFCPIVQHGEKCGLGLRPIYHQKDTRCDGHIFITLLAYHVLHTIRFKLRQKGVRLCWTTIRRQLSTQVRITTTMKRQDGKVIRIRKSSKAESSHHVIYDALNLAYQPGRRVKTIL